MQISGHVVYEDVEGGVWGIVDDKGRRFQPVDGIPRKFRVAGKRISASVEPTNLASAAMWGIVVHLRHIEAA